MPEYLQFGTALSELEPEEVEEKLLRQLSLLQDAVNRLHEADRVRAEIFDSVVSV